jgi:superoxide dismutase, Fe-Mn family
MAFELPKLSYEYNALEPFIDARTMEIHHSKHHQAYILKVNDAIKGTEFEKMSVEDLISDLNKLPESIRPVVRNNGGGHANHTLFWQIMAPHDKPNVGGEPIGELAEAITATFGSYANFKNEFTNAALNRFGSGWAWLSVEKGKLKVESTPNQDSPLMEGRTPLLGLDVWEHAYYLHYQNRRPDYVAAFYNLVNWGEVGKRFKDTK